MYLAKISDFLPKYSNLQYVDFFRLLDNPRASGFLKIKLEKDFLLTLILIKFSEVFPNLIFKGGTCLNKCYFPYFRLSEDLDFVINISKCGRSKRKTLLRQYENDFVRELALLGLRLQEGRTKFDEYRLALFTFEYVSVLTGDIQTIKIDISLKQQLYVKPSNQIIQAIFLDDIFEVSFFQEHSIACIDIMEAMAEKMRAALTRSEPAIRDFFDLWYVWKNTGFDFGSRDYHNLLNLKLDEVSYMYTLDDARDSLHKQVETDLRPVLRDMMGFDFDVMWDFVQSFRPTKS